MTKTKKGKYNERVNVGEELILRQFKSWRGKLLSIMIATLIDLGIKAFGPLHNESVPQHSQAVLVSPSAEMTRSGLKRGAESREESGRPSQVRAGEMDGRRSGIWGEEYLNQETNEATTEVEVMAEVEEPNEEPSMISDLSDYSKDQLLELVQEQRKQLFELQSESCKKRKELPPLSKDEKVIDNEVRSIMRNEIVRWFKFPEGGWNLWSEMDGTVCKILCDKMVSWPTGATSVEKRRIWEKTIAPRLGRKLSLIKNKISQKMREVFMSKYANFVYECCKRGSV